MAFGITPADYLASMSRNLVRDYGGLMIQYPKEMVSRRPHDPPELFFVNSF